MRGRGETVSSVLLRVKQLDKLSELEAAAAISSVAQLLIAGLVIIFILRNGPRPVYFLFLLASGTLTAALLCKALSKASDRYRPVFFAIPFLFLIATLWMLWKVAAI